MRFLIVCFSFFLLTTIAYAQDSKEDDATKEEKKEKSIDLKVVPYVSYNRTYEAMFGAVPLMMYRLNKNDTISPKSISGVIGVYTTNKSWFGVGFTQLYFKEDRWRATIAAGLGDVNSQFVLSESLSNLIQYGTGVNFFAFYVKRRVAKGLYVGANYLYTEYDNQFDTAMMIESQNSLNGIGLSLLWDIRDDVYYPLRGHKFELDYLSFSEFLGNEDVSNEVSLTYNKYLSKKDSNNVLALRGHGAFGFGDVVFNNLLFFGDIDLRGYTQGEFRGKQLVAAQAEYRYNFHKKWGVIGFAGAGTVFESDIEKNNGIFLPSLGGGIRYMVFPENKVRIGLEAAVGRNDWGIYFRIGETF